MMIKRLLLLVLLFALLLPSPARAQSDGAVYIVQPGDTLLGIANRFRLRLEDLMQANGLTNPNLIYPGQRLILPGLEGIQGVLTTVSVPLGATLQTLARRYQTDLALLRRLNHLVSPGELYIGQSLILLQSENETPQGRFTLAPGESWLEAAVRQGANPWSLLTWNGLSSPVTALPGEAFFAPSKSESSPAQALPPAFFNATLTPLPPIQGDTVVIKVQVAPGYTVRGKLADHELHFFPLEEKTQVALQGIRAMLDPGIYPLQLEASAPDGSVQAFEQGLLVRDAGYPEDPIIYVKDETTIDPKVTDAEWTQVLQIVSAATPQRYWEGLFQSPASLFPDPNCYTSRFGNRREYRSLNGSEPTLTSFHSGLDFCGGSGLAITAPAAGKVVYTGLLTVRGNVTFIDHGWGVYSGYFHQSQIQVQVGDLVTPGQTIGVVGDTGRVTGAHLHWEIWVNGVQVNPLRWLENVYP